MVGGRSRARGWLQGSLPLGPHPSPPPLPSLVPVSAIGSCARSGFLLRGPLAWPGHHPQMETWPEPDTVGATVWGRGGDPCIQPLAPSSPPSCPLPGPPGSVRGPRPPAALCPQGPPGHSGSRGSSVPAQNPHPDIRSPTLVASPAPGSSCGREDQAWESLGPGGSPVVAPFSLRPPLSSCAAPGPPTRVAPLSVPEAHGEGAGVFVGLQLTAPGPSPQGCSPGSG